MGERRGERGEKDDLGSIYDMSFDVCERGVKKVRWRERHKREGQNEKKKLNIVSSGGDLTNIIVYGGISATWLLVQRVFLQFTLVKNLPLLSIWHITTIFVIIVVTLVIFDTVTDCFKHDCHCCYNCCHYFYCYYYHYHRDTNIVIAIVIATVVIIIIIATTINITVNASGVVRT